MKIKGSDDESSLNGVDEPGESGDVRSLLTASGNDPQHPFMTSMEMVFGASLPTIPHSQDLVLDKLKEIESGNNNNNNNNNKNSLPQIEEKPSESVVPNPFDNLILKIEHEVAHRTNSSSSLHVAKELPTSTMDDDDDDEEEVKLPAMGVPRTPMESFRDQAFDDREVPSAPPFAAAKRYKQPSSSSMVIPRAPEKPMERSLRERQRRRLLVLVVLGLMALAAMGGALLGAQFHKQISLHTMSQPSAQSWHIEATGPVLTHVEPLSIQQQPPPSSHPSSTMSVVALGPTLSFVGQDEGS